MKPSAVQLQERYFLLGECDDEQLLELYQQARAFVFPGEDDFGITPLEAQACTPVIAYAAEVHWKQ